MISNIMIPSLPEALKIILSRQEHSSYLWRCLTAQNLFCAELRRLVSEIGDSSGQVSIFQECWDLVIDDRFESRLAYIFHEKRGDGAVDVSRLTRNARKLIATAAFASGIKHLFKGRRAAIPWLVTWIGRCFSETDSWHPALEEGWSEELLIHRSVQPAVRYLLRNLAPFGAPTLSVQYWCYFWLGYESVIEKGNLTVPIVSVAGRYNQSQYGYIHLTVLEEGISNDELVEHPESALVPLGSELLGGFNRAWQSAYRKSIGWNLHTHFGVQNGDSLSAAAAVGMRLVLNQEVYDQSRLILARLGEDLNSLEPVDSAFEKVQEARRHLIRRVAIASSQVGSNQETGLSERELLLLGSQDVQLSFVRTLQEASTFISRKTEDTRMKNVNQILGHYTRKEVLREDDLKLVATAYSDRDDSLYLIKLWSYQDDSESLLIRALWDNELRNLYRLSSSPGANESLLTMKDAGIDQEIPAFAVVLHGQGFRRYETLVKALNDRQSYAIFQKKNLDDVQTRYAIWKGLRRIAEGIVLLHSQDVMHRNVGAETIYFDPSMGVESWRLGGFEWSLRLGSTPTSGITQNWSIPPENKTEDGARYTFEGDWYGFGMLAARCFNTIEGYSTFPPADINRRVLSDLDSCRISNLEKTLISRLIASDLSNRLTFGHDVIKHLEAILEELSIDKLYKEENAPLVLVIDKKATWVIDLAEKFGFYADPDDTKIQYNPSIDKHVAELKEFFRERLKNSRLYPIPGQNDAFTLDTNSGITLRIVQHNNRFEGGIESWDFAFAISESYLTGARTSEYERSLEGKKFNVVISSEVSQNVPHESWEKYLPIISEKKDVSRSLREFQEFLRCTNQLELLMGSAEIFSVSIKEKWESADGFEHVVLVDTDDRPQPSFTRKQGGMAVALQGKIDTGSRRVLLTEHDTLKLEKISLEDSWAIVDVPNREDKTVEVKRRKGQGLKLFEKDGYIRSYDLYGQFRLLERRKLSIDRLEKHAYLLRSLVQPGMVNIDTGTIHQLPFPPNPDEIDSSKLAVLKDILRVRPIYALQGPPGTGKTTLVSYLLREILEQDPVAQILVTAQAHGAVDVLREKVQIQAFKGAAPPLAIRVGIDSDGEDEQEGSIRQVTRNMLERTRDTLSARPQLSELQQEWFDKLPFLLAAATSQGRDRQLSDMERLVKIGASITYCTTSSGDLESLASSNQSFDWCVVEEAGKAHGFDLALPLQTAHRWLLLGDYNQLPPYRIDDFEVGLNQLDEAVSALDSIPGRDTRLIDYEWIDEWRNRPQEKAKEFVGYFLDWLKTFEKVFRTLRQLPPADEQSEQDVMMPGVTTTFSKGAWAGQLTSQYRMHPIIGDLISSTFYNGTVSNKTVDNNGNPSAMVTHSLIKPEGVKGQSIIWLDTKWSKYASEFAELGPRQKSPRYTNLKEVELIRTFLSNMQCDVNKPKPMEITILSPYAQQVATINQNLKDFELPQGLKFRLSLTGRRRGRDTNVRTAHTVDSFQGNQSDIVIISLVRNNDRERTKQPLGFLDDPHRLNVLLSRAESLLILVGSWDFYANAVQYVSEYDRLKDWKKIILFLSEAFNEGRALKIPYDQIISGETMDKINLRRII